ncbi:MAG: ABATE domain-containing protein, partial [Gemmatimonadota bacterium]|nr:ABATE domain-containing protein [Gemmatimonadota bacterium]
MTPPPDRSVPSPAARGPGFAFVGERLWLDFVNADPAAGGPDALEDFESLVRWLEAAAVVDPDRA